MATFGLDSKYITAFKKDLNTDFVRRDQASDFFLLPQLDAILKHCGKDLKDQIATKLKDSKYAPKPPIDMEIPKSVRISAKTGSIVTPNYFRPGSVLYPEDRVLYHYIGQVAVKIAEEQIDRDKVFSNRPLAIKGSGFSPASLRWAELKTKLENEIRTGKYSLVMKCDITQYFSSINQHELVNQLEHQGLPQEYARFCEKFLATLTMDRSSRGIIQGVYASDGLGNGYLVSIDEFIEQSGLMHFRYVDDIYILFESSDQLRSFFPSFVKRLRDYDLSLNESKTYISPPMKLLQEETELDKAIEIAKIEAIEALTNYEEIEIETGPYGETATELLETPPNDQEVELQATRSIFENLDDFKGEERHRAEGFCLNIFRRAADPIALNYVLKRWIRNPDRAREYALYLNRFAADPKHSKAIDAKIVEVADQMLDFQWAWAALVVRRFRSISKELLAICTKGWNDGSRHEVVRSLFTYIVAKHGSSQQRKALRDGYSTSPTLVQLAIIHNARHFTSGERNAFFKTAEAHGELQALMVKAFKEEWKSNPSPQ